MVVGKIPIALATSLSLAMVLGGGNEMGFERNKDQGECGYKEVLIIGSTEEENTAACRALRDVVGFFTKIDLDIQPRFKLRFSDDLTNTEAADDLYGYFNSETHEIVIGRNLEDKWWGLNVKQEQENILRHEMIHMALISILNDNPNTLPRAWHEFIVYAIQIELLPTVLRQRFLRQHEDIGEFDEESYINDAYFQFAPPSTLAIKSYKTYLVRGGESFVKKILSRAYNTPDFLVSPIT